MYLWTVAVTVAFVLTFSPLAQGGLFSNRIDKARDFAKANMIDKAVEVLNQEIEENPTNAEAHYELGSIYLDHGEFGHAEARFKGAVGLDVKYKKRVTQKYMDTGNAMMNRGKEHEARRCFDVAASHDEFQKLSNVGEGF
jgi:Flp pilus assembly protein TadD